MKTLVLLLLFTLAATIFMFASPAEWGLKGSWLVTAAYINIWLLAMIYLIKSINEENIEKEKIALRFALMVAVFSIIKIAVYVAGSLPASIANAPGLFPWIIALTLIMLLALFFAKIAYIKDLNKIRAEKNSRIDAVFEGPRDEELSFTKREFEEYQYGLKRRSENE